MPPEIGLQPRYGIVLTLSFNFRDQWMGTPMAVATSGGRLLGRIEAV